MSVKRRARESSIREPPAGRSPAEEKKKQRGEDLSRGLFWTVVGGP
jgi:hypothetical protein